MTYAVVEDMPQSWEWYRLISEGVFEPPPHGLIAYVAGRTDEGVRVVGIWEDEESWRRFRRLWIAHTDSALRGVPAPTPVLRDLHAEHLVVPRT